MNGRRRLFQFKAEHKLTKVYHVAVPQQLSLLPDRLEVDPCAAYGARIHNEIVPVFRLSNAGMPGGQGWIVEHVARLGGIRAEGHLLGRKWDRSSGSRLKDLTRSAEGIGELCDEMRQSGITISTVCINGHGDPSFSQHATGGTDVLASLRPWADSLRAHGIRTVTGRVVGDGSWFADPPLGRGWAWDDLDYGYSAGVDELFFNEGISNVTVYAAKTVGGTATVRTSPARTVPRIGRVSVVTGGMMDPDDHPMGDCRCRSIAAGTRKKTIDISQLRC